MYQPSEACLVHSGFGMIVQGIFKMAAILKIILLGLNNYMCIAKFEVFGDRMLLGKYLLDRSPYFKLRTSF